MTPSAVRTRCFGGVKADRKRGARRLWAAVGGLEGRLEYSWPWRLAPACKNMVSNEEAASGGRKGNQKNKRECVASAEDQPRREIIELPPGQSAAGCLAISNSRTSPNSSTGELMTLSSPCSRSSNVRDPPLCSELHTLQLVGTEFRNSRSVATMKWTAEAARFPLIWDGDVRKLGCNWCRSEMWLMSSARAASPQSDAVNGRDRSSSGVVVRYSMYKRRRKGNTPQWVSMYDHAIDFGRKSECREERNCRLVVVRSTASGQGEGKEAQRREGNCMYV